MLKAKELLIALSIVIAKVQWSVSFSPDVTVMINVPMEGGCIHSVQRICRARQRKNWMIWMSTTVRTAKLESNRKSSKKTYKTCRREWLRNRLMHTMLMKVPMLMMINK